MATNLEGLCIGQYQAQLLVITTLDDDCTPLTGSSAQTRTKCFSSVQLSPQYDEGQEFGRLNADGSRCWFVKDCDRFKQIDVTATLLAWDYEQLSQFTGSALVLGAGGGDWAGDVIGFEMPGADADCTAAVSLEIYTKAAPATGGGGVCAVAGAGFPSYTRSLLPWMRSRFGDITFDDSTDGAVVNLSGFAQANPNWGTGPANNWEGDGGVGATTPFTQTFSNTLPTTSCGFAASVA